jgi:integrase
MRRGAKSLRHGRFTADEVTAEAARLVASGEHLRHGTPDQRTVVTVNDLCSAYQGLYQIGASAKARSTCENVRRCLDHIRRLIGPTKLVRLTVDVLVRYRNSRLGEKASTGTISKELNVMASAINHAHESRWMPMDAPTHLPRLPEIRHVPANCNRTPTQAEVEDVIKWFDQRRRVRSNAAQWQYRTLVLAADTGARIGEISSLVWNDVFLERGELVFNGKTGKRAVALSKRLQEELPKWRDGAAGTRPVIAATPHMAASRGRDDLRLACEELGIERFTHHGIRRLMVRRMIRSGTPLSVAASITGHSVGVMLRHYEGFTEDERTAAMASLDVQAAK